MINTIVWVPSLLQMLSQFKVLDRPHVNSLKNVFFGGEVFQTKHFNRWRNEYPEVNFMVSFCPTEVTDTCAYYKIKRDFRDDDILPAGYSCLNK